MTDIKAERKTDKKGRQKYRQKRQKEIQTKKGRQKKADRKTDKKTDRKTDLTFRCLLFHKRDLNGHKKQRRNCSNLEAIQGDQLFMDVCFWYLVKGNLPSVPYCTDRQTDRQSLF